ncbi:hypothetical protein K7X08_036691 [Anisodus acutangulus]|uniref:Uncharacterized protein n=1 Tax=Anisodus acutangulus TaxID=402998 RepID=A0A9Q1QWI3_9SOLA|nr:hypothetical protein K7X08_036691 [Anisodus acutangulus]
MGILHLGLFVLLKKGDVKSFEGKRKVVLALKAKDSTLRKAVVAKNALELVAKKDKNKGLLKSGSVRSDDTNLTEAVNDAEFAFQLHRAMNSSQRISKTLCPMNSSYVADPEILELSNVSCKLLDLGQTVSNYPAELLTYKRSRLKRKMCKETVGLSDLITEELDLRVSQREGSQHNLHLQNVSTLGSLSSGGDNTVQERKNALSQGQMCMSILFLNQHLIPAYLQIGPWNPGHHQMSDIRANAFLYKRYLPDVSTIQESTPVNIYRASDTVL